MSIEVVKEFSIEHTRAMRFEGLVLQLGPDTSPYVSWVGVKRLDGPSPLALVGVESKAYVGMVKLGVEEDGKGGLAIRAQGLLDYDTAERMLLETGELGLEVEVRLGSRYDQLVPLNADGVAMPEAITVLRAYLCRRAANATQTLVPAPMSWSF